MVSLSDRPLVVILGKLGGKSVRSERGETSSYLKPWLVVKSKDSVTLLVDKIPQS